MHGAEIENLWSPNLYLVIGEVVAIGLWPRLHDGGWLAKNLWIL
jgi:hypothetical protein